MFDGITIDYEIKNYEAWRLSVNLSSYVNVETGTGETKTKKTEKTIVTICKGKFESFDFFIKEVEYLNNREKRFYLTLKGSLHKNHFNGNNYLPFTWEILQYQISHLCKKLSISPTDARISTLEVGVNICTPFEVSPFIRQNIIDYKGQQFNNYDTDNKGFCLGSYCKLTQYVVKIYDKGKQNNLSQNLMRVEIRFQKMQVLNKHGIKHLSDLQDIKKVKALLPLLIAAWKNVLIYDIEENVEALTLKPEEEKLLNYGQSPKLWERLKKQSPESFKYQRTKFRQLVARFGKNYSLLIKELIIKEWESLFKNSPNLPLR